MEEESSYMQSDFSRKLKEESEDESESEIDRFSDKKGETTMNYDGGSVSLYTLQQFIKQQVPYISLNLMIQTEYCSGQTLKEYILKRGSKINRPQNFKIFQQIINGVHTIHEANIIHRDLKPENVFLDENQTVKIGDFGLARAFESMMFPSG